MTEPTSDARDTPDLAWEAFSRHERATVWRLEIAVATFTN